MTGLFQLGFLQKLCYQLVQQNDRYQTDNCQNHSGQQLMQGEAAEACQPGGQHIYEFFHNMYTPL